MKNCVLTIVILFSVFTAYSQNTATQQKIQLTHQSIESGAADSETLLKQLEQHIKSQKDYEAFSDYTKLLLRHYRRSGQYAVVSNAIQDIRKNYRPSDKTLMDMEIISLWIDLYNDRFDNLVSKSDSLLKSEPNAIQKGWILYFEGQGKNETGDYESASAHYLESTRLFSSANHSEGLSYAYTGVGDIQRNLGNQTKAIEYYQKALAAARQASNITAEINASLLIGAAHSISKDYQAGLKNHTHAFELSEKDRDYYNMARSLNNIGNAHLRMDNLTEALKANQMSLEICLNNKMDYGAIANYLNICRIHLSSNQYKNAIESLDDASGFIAGRNFPAEQAEIMRNYSQIYEKMGDFKKSLHYYKEYDSLRKKLVSEQTQRVVNELQIKYESEIKDRQLEKVNYELSLKKSVNRSLILGLGLVILATGFAIFFLIYRNRRLRELYNTNIENMQAHRFIRKAATAEDEPLRKIFDKVLSMLEKDELYKKPTLSLTEMAELIGSNEKYISSAISKYSESNYSNFINLYRVNEAKRLIYEQPGININDVMIHCGFNSRTPFYNAFIKFTGMSPKQFKDMKTSANFSVNEKSH